MHRPTTVLEVSRVRYLGMEDDGLTREEYGVKQCTYSDDFRGS